jgi:3-deoxy-D-manno-octulosonic-acid transferase
MSLLDLLYIPLALVTAPAWALKKRGGWAGRFGKGDTLPPKQPDKPRVMLHAVSVGEVSALRSLVPLLTPEVEVVITTTTDTGMARAKELFGTTCRIERYPLDFSWSVRRFLDRVAPDVVALVELEVWPQFVDACHARGIPACIINGRLSERSSKGYARIATFFGKRLRKLAFAAVQDADYAQRFEALGLPSDKCLIVGTMKWDGAGLVDDVPGAHELATQLGIDRSKPLIVAGSTAEDEEALLVAAKPAGAQLLCAPRKPEHFEEAARAMPGCVRRTNVGTGNRAAELFLLDTIGELRKAYSLADVVVVGRSFGSLYGSDPIEPIALGKPTIIGPATADFTHNVRTLTAGNGLLQIPREQLAETLSQLLANPARRAALAQAGRAVIREQQGASARHADLILTLIRK